jgi:flagellar biogenesis protein FliO
MVDLALLQSISYMAGALGVCVAAIYYVMKLRTKQTNLKTTLETRQMQLHAGTPRDSNQRVRQRLDRDNIPSKF